MKEGQGKGQSPGITATLKLLNKISSKIFMVSGDSHEKHHEIKLLYLMIL